MSQNMFISWIFLFILWINVQGVPLNLPKLRNTGNVHFVATLTSVKSFNKYLMTEDLAGYYDAQGRIEISKGSEITTVFYNDDDDFRLVMDDKNDCQSFVYQKGNWNNMLPGVTSPLENYLLLFGPSIYLRIIEWVQEASKGWIKGNPQMIRGLKMETLSIDIERYLNVTVFYSGKKGLDDPSRVEFRGQLPPSMHSGYNPVERLFIDFYSIEYTKEDVLKIVQPTPGIGCLRYTVPNRSFPAMKYDRVYYREIDSDEDPLPVDSTNHRESHQAELYINNVDKVVRISANFIGHSLTRLIDDFNLGVGYFLDEKNSCSHQPLNSDNGGVIDGEFNFKDLLWMNGPFKYLGEIFYDRRSGTICQVWEALQFNVMVDSKKYDKHVTTVYFTKKVFDSGPLTTEQQSVPVGVTRKGYIKEKSGQYKLQSSKRKDIFNFAPTELQSEFQSLFQISECFESPSQRRTFGFDIRPYDHSIFNLSMKAAEDNLYTLRETLITSITKSLTITPLRIANVDFEFNPERIVAKVLFLEEPPISSLFRRRPVQVKLSDLHMITVQTTKQADECLKEISPGSNSRQVIWCPGKGGMNTCSMTSNPLNIVEDTVKGIHCQLFEHPLGNLPRALREVPLSQLHDSLVSSMIDAVLTLQVESRGMLLNKNQYKFTITNILSQEMPTNIQASKLLFTEFEAGSTLNPSLTGVEKALGSIHNFGDCYRACQNSEALQCESFSYCDRGGRKVECLVSNLDPESGNQKTIDLLRDDSSCYVYTKPHISNYKKIEGRMFLTKHNDQQLESDTQPTEEQCAKQCEALKDCKTFQFCGSNRCTLYSLGLKLSRTTETIDCNIYMPKRIHNFKMTGTDVVQTVIHTELDLDLEQCAALCFDYRNGEDQCKSFNYCPKGVSRSSCGLARVRISSESVKTSPSTDCRNYGLIEPFDELASASFKSASVGTSGGTIFGIIFAMSFVGMLLGFFVHFGYLRYSRGPAAASLIPESIRWARQIDDHQL